MAKKRIKKKGKPNQGTPKDKRLKNNKKELFGKKNKKK